jgi:hypothetical protein
MNSHVAKFSRQLKPLDEPGALWTITASVRFQVLTAASMKFRFAFWDVLPCKIFFDRRFRDTCCTLLWNVGRKLFYRAVHPRRQTWTSLLPRLYFIKRNNKCNIHIAWCRKGQWGKDIPLSGQYIYIWRMQYLLVRVLSLKYYKF